MPTHRPNVLMIMTDQQRWDGVGVNGNPVIRTPHLDAIARDGISLTHHYTAAMACVPSRACILTGQHTHVNGVTSTGGESWVRPGTPTLPGCFSAQGYTSVCVGKMHTKPWHLLSGYDRRVIIDSKYDCSGRQDEYRVFLQQMGLYEKTIGHHTPGFGKAFKAMPTSELPAELHIDGYTGKRGAETLEQLIAKGSPFFLTVSFNGPHDPFDPPAPYDTMYDQAEMPIGLWREGELDCLPEEVYRDIIDMGIEHLNLTGLSDAKKQQVAAYYYGNISLIDDCIGRLVETLKRHHLYDDTIILHTSDHGEYLGDHNNYSKGSFPCESDCRVPLIFKAPGVNGAGKRDALVSNVDIMPTLLEAAGLPIPETCQGLPLAPLIRGEVEDTRDCAVTFSECSSAYRIRTRDWAYVYRPARGHDQLYYLPDDPHELYNLADNSTPTAEQEQMRNRLLSWFIENHAPSHLGSARQLPYLVKP